MISYVSTSEIVLRSSKLRDGPTGDLRRNNGKKTRGNNTAKHPNTIAKTTLGRVKRDIADIYLDTWHTSYTISIESDTRKRY